MKTETSNTRPWRPDGRAPGDGGSCDSRSSAIAPGLMPRAAFRSADGYQDYFTLLNERDGGIGGVDDQSDRMRNRL